MIKPVDRTEQTAAGPAPQPPAPVLTGTPAYRVTFRRGRGAGSFLLSLGVDTLGTGLFLPISLLYFNRVAGIPLPTVGMLLSAASLLTMPVVMSTGQLVDRFGSRNIVVFAQLLQAFGFLTYLLVDSPVTLLPAALLVAVGQRMFWASFFALVTDLSRPDADRERQDRWFAVVGTAQCTAFGIGGLVAGLVVGSATGTVFKLLVFINALTFAISAAMLTRSVTGHRPPGGTVLPGGYRILLSDRPYLMLILVNCVFALCSTFLVIAVPVYVIEALPAPKWIVGPILALNTVLLSAGQLLLARVARSISRVRALAVAGILWSVWCVGLALAVRVPTRLLVPYLIVVMMCYTLAELIHGPISNSLSAAAAPELVRGRYLAAFQVSFTVATVVAPGLFAVLFSYQRSLPWLVVAGLAVLGTIGISALEGRLPRHAVYGQSSSG